MSLDIIFPQCLDGLLLRYRRVPYGQGEDQADGSPPGQEDRIDKIYILYFYLFLFYPPHS